jgi:UDP-3-O-[3-hydroxymyristoyl] glucosamine N-acyltransferase
MQKSRRLHEKLQDMARTATRFMRGLGARTITKVSKMDQELYKQIVKNEACESQIHTLEATVASNQKELVSAKLSAELEMLNYKASQAAAAEAASKQVTAFKKSANPSSSHQVPPQEPPPLQTLGRSSVVDGESSKISEGSIPAPIFLLSHFSPSRTILIGPIVTTRSDSLCCICNFPIHQII